jgi:hypothetical protein
MYRPGFFTPVCEQKYPKVVNFSGKDRWRPTLPKGADSMGRIRAVRFAAKITLFGSVRETAEIGPAIICL